METKTDLSTEIKAIIAKKLEIKISEVNDEKYFETDLKADSLDIVEMWIEIEKKIRVSISDDEISKTKTVKDMIEIAESAKKRIKEEKNIDMTDRIIGIIKDDCNCKMTEIKPESNLKNNLGINSLDIVSIVYNLEAEFKIEIPEKEWKAFETVGDIIKHVTDKIEKK